MPLGGVVLILFFAVATALSGIRSPGKYSGIVVFDRWDTCYLYSGTYLMYVSEAKKALLRKYAGRSIQLDVTEVFQPINPGDGLITEFTVLGDSPNGATLPPIEGLSLKLTADRYGGDLLRFTIGIENQNRSSVSFLKSELSPTVFGVKTNDDPFLPSDGISKAKITRCNFGSHCGFPGLSFGPDGQLTSDSFSVDVEGGLRQDPYRIVLAGGRKLQFHFYLRISEGDYELVVGYGGGVHEGKGLISNAISFSADASGHVTAPKKPEMSTYEKPNFTRLLFDSYSNPGSPAALKIFLPASVR